MLATDFSQDHRREYGDLARQFFLLGGNLLFDQIDFLNDLPRLHIEQLADFGEGQFAGGPLQQTHTQAVFQALDTATDGGARHIAKLRRLNKAAQLHHLYKISDIGYIHERINGLSQPPDY